VVTVSVVFGMASVVLLTRRREFIGVDPPRPASPRSRSPLDFWRRPAAPGFAALAIAAGFLASTRRARLRRARDRR
jgi:hypothetical protein